MNDQMLYLSTDGDDAGKSVSNAAMSDNEQALSEASQKIEAGQAAIENWILQHGGQKITVGGDEGNWKLPAQAIEELESLRADYNFASGLTLTVGVGSTLSEANKALIAGKARGKNQVSQYEPIVEHELQSEHNGDSQAVAEDSTPDPEATPLAEQDAQYDHDHTEDCQYCQPAEDHAHTDDCQYCAAADAEPTHDHTDDCKYCAAAESNDHEHTDDCQYCDQMTQPEPDHEHTDDCQYCAQMPQDHDHTENCEYCANMGQPSPEQSGDLLTQELDSQTPGQPSHQDVNAIDESSMPVGNAMDGNVSTTDDYNGEMQDQGQEGEAPAEMQPQDDGQEEDPQPNMASVLQGNLDQHGDQIAKEKIITLVGQALEGFKANKQILEKAKEQAPELYSSTIAMLKAMIEMAKMLGLNGGQEQPQEAPAEEQASQAAPQEGQPDPKASPL